MLDTVTNWVRKGPSGTPSKDTYGRAKAKLDDLAAQLHRAEQNLQVEAAARKQAERQAEKFQSQAKAAAKWAGALDEESALLHKQHVILAQDLKTANQALELARAGSQNLPASPTPSEQLVREVQTAKVSWMQSQDCMRLMASSAAAAEARAKHLQDLLATVEEQLAAAKAQKADLESINKKQEMALASSTSQICALEDRLDRALAQAEKERLQGILLKKQLQQAIAQSQAVSANVPALEKYQPGYGIEASTAEHGTSSGLVRALSEGQTDLIGNLAKCQEREQEKGVLSVSLPSPLQPVSPLMPDLEASLCNLSSPAALAANPLQRAALKNWAHRASPAKDAPGCQAEWNSCSQASDQENCSPEAALQGEDMVEWQVTKQAAKPATRNPFRLAPEKQQAASNEAYLQPAVGKVQTITSAQTDANCGQLSASPTAHVGEAETDTYAEGKLAAPDISLQADTNLSLHHRRGFSAGATLNQSSDFGPLGRGQAHLQDVVQMAQDGSPPKKDRQERQPLSPANRPTNQQHNLPRTQNKSPFSKGSPLKRTPAGDGRRHEPMHAAEQTIVFPLAGLESDDLVHQEDCGPLGMGSRGVDDHCTPPKEKGALAMHKGLLKFAHKVPPMRIGRGGSSPYHSPSKGS